jgi:hypothetical protein
MSIELSGRIIQMLNNVRGILPHPVWGIVVATLIAFSGRGELLLRSVGMVLIAIWLALDLWAWLLDRAPHGRWTLVYGATSTSLMLIIVAGIMWWWMDGKLKDQQDEVFQDLELQVRPPGRGRLYDALFTLTNKSHFDVERHALVCFSVVERYENSNPASNVSRAFSSDKVLIKNGGDSETLDCGKNMTVTHPLKCADLIVQFRYVLMTQPKDEKERKFRFVTRPEQGGYSWIAEPLESKEIYCR